MNSTIRDAVRDSSTRVAPARGLRARLRRMIPADDSVVLWLRLWRGLAVLALLSGFASVARANCGVRVGDLAMGPYDPIGTHATAHNDSGSTTVEVTCNKPPPGPPQVPFVADLGPGGNASGTQRRMIAGPGQYLAYGVFLDAGRSVAFGTQSGGIAVACEAGTSSGYCTGGNGPGRERWARFTLFGRVPAGQDPAAGAYRDTLVLTISY
jgi:spore coat protein U-like protein